MVALRVRRVRPEDEFVVAYDQYVGFVLISFLGPRRSMPGHTR